MTEAPVLKPCPFCGGEAIEAGKLIDAELVFVFCLECEAQTNRFGTEKQATEAWNCRVGDEK